ncbi:hypothetical protein GCM10008904_09790 [Paraclostridium ghonii]|uniref:Uncharacterized protein n=1 Tax=Paraclostridium ghonii TaxID=29358 RepID=A0ABU0MYJ9_9FIRM|nr:hypothetical protein [Paeniclostridium ghonii]MDQ0555992.1 hypothetical protein [Paeniclostridium ghonii]
MNFKNINKIIKIMKIVLVMFGIVLLIINFTIGEKDVSLQSTMTTLVRMYTYFVLFIVVFEGLSKYIYRHKNK